jgi:hypothetical protein
VHKIPHYTFGRLVGFEDISLYFLFPQLYREDQQSSRLRDDDFRIWMDQVLTQGTWCSLPDCMAVRSS